MDLRILRLLPGYDDLDMLVSVKSFLGIVSESRKHVPEFSPKKKKKKKEGKAVVLIDLIMKLYI